MKSFMLCLFLIFLSLPAFGQASEDVLRKIEDLAEEVEKITNLPEANPRDFVAATSGYRRLEQEILISDGFTEDSCLCRQKLPSTIINSLDFAEGLVLIGMGDQIGYGVIKDVAKRQLEKVREIANCR